MKHAREDYNRIQDPENKIPEDEPVFLLRGQDKFAPSLLRQWADFMQEEEGGQEMADMVFEHADKMEEWQKEHGSKIPDLKK